MKGSFGLAKEVLTAIPNIELVEFDCADQCCGFGGAFSITHPNVSLKIGETKIANWLDSGVEEVVGGDMGCLMHLQGIANRKKQKIKFRHYAELMVEELA